MTFRSESAIRQRGFEGFVTISALQASNCAEVPAQPGVYLILNPDTARPEFLPASIGGHFKGKDPTAEVSRLESKCEKDALAMNIGKAGLGRATPRSRLRQYMRFGAGEPIGHRGGRYIWQLRDSGNLVVCWRVLPDGVPRAVEKALIAEFETVYTKLPFASLTH